MKGCGHYARWREGFALVAEIGRGFVTALKHLVQPMEAILNVRPDAIFIRSESSEYFRADSPAAIGPAELRNAERFLSIELNYGR